MVNIERTCVHIIDSKTLSDLENPGVEIKVQGLPKHQSYVMGAHLSDGTNPTIVCTKCAVIGTELHIRHGTALILRGLLCFVTEQRVEDLLLSRQLLERLGLNTRDVLSAPTND